MKYAIAVSGGNYLDTRRPAGFRFVPLEVSPLYESQGEALAALQEYAMRRSYVFATELRLVRVDEVFHISGTKEVRRKFPEPKADGTISTRYEVNPHCTAFPEDRFHRYTADDLIELLTTPLKCPGCGGYTVEALDTVQTPPTTTRVASELK